MLICGWKSKGSHVLCWAYWTLWSPSVWEADYSAEVSATVEFEDSSIDDLTVKPPTACRAETETEDISKHRYLNLSATCRPSSWTGQRRTGRFPSVLHSLKFDIEVFKSFENVSDCRETYHFCRDKTVRMFIIYKTSNGTQSPVSNNAAVF